MVSVDPVRLATLVERLGGACTRLGENREGSPVIGDVHLDSRLVGAGDLFAALPGRTADGGSFVPEAVARGAAAVLSPAPLRPALRIPHWIHPRARSVAGRAASLVHGEPSRGMWLIGITGTNGKTTTAHLAGQLLEACGRRPAVLGTTGYRLAGGVEEPASHTTPDGPALQRLLRRHRELGGDSAALELSSHALAQERHAGLAISVAVFTNLTRDHLDYHGDLESYAAAKARLFESLDSDAYAVVNADDPAGERMARAAAERGARVVTFSTRSRADLGATRLETDSRGSRFSIHGMGITRTSVELPLVGRFNVENALAALAAVLLSGASPSHALGGLATVIPARGRLQPVPGGDGSITVLVDYAHTPDALRQVLESLRSSLAGGESGSDGESSGRLICVFGCGGDRDPGKRAPMGRAVRELADVGLVTSDNPRGEDPLAIIDQVLVGMREEGRAQVVVQPDRALAIHHAIESARPGDLVLIAGKGHETTQTVGERVTPFDDLAVAAEALRGRGAAPESTV